MDERISALLACPRCATSLGADDGGNLRCTDPECELSGSEPFPVVQGRPVLVDFSDSILSRADLVTTAAASQIPRNRGRVRALLGRMIRGGNPQASKRAGELLRRLRADGGPMSILVVGGGRVGSGAEDLYRAEDVLLIGFDIYASPHTAFIADGHRIPLLSGAVDAVWIQAVLEHVLDPQRVVDEIERVLRPGGLVYAETPFMQQVHEGAYDFTRFTESGHRWLFRRFDCLSSGVVLGPGTAAWWALVHLIAAFTRNIHMAEILAIPFIWLRWLDHLTSGVWAAKGASAVSFLGQKAGREVTPEEIVAFYHRERGR